MGKFPFKRPRIISKKFPELDSSIDGVTKSLNDLVFSYHEQVHHALSKKHWMMAFSSFALILVLGSFISMRGKADSSIFYPDTCLGGWLNPQNAQGEPQTTSNMDESQFTKKNSAILPENTNADMYCGNFKGKFDATTKPTKIIVSLALTKGAEASLEEELTPEIIVATTTEVIVDLASSTSELLPQGETGSSTVTTSTTTEVSTTTTIETAIATPGKAKDEGPSVMEGIIKSVQDTISDLFESKETKSTQTDTVVIPPPQPVEEKPVTPQPQPEAAPSEPSSSPTSYLPLKNEFLSQFVGTVFAEEVPAEQVKATETEVTSQEVTSEVKSEVATTNVEPEVVQEEKKDNAEVAPTVLGVSTTTEAVSEVTISEVSTTTTASTTGNVATSSLLLEASTTSVVATTTEESQNNFLEVFYTFDGKTWQSLGVLNEISMKYRTFEIPVHASTSWTDMSQLQVKIEARKHALDTPVVYLDGLKVEVLYESTFEHAHPDFKRDTILKDEIIDGMRIVTIINNDTNREEVWYMYLEDETASSSLETATSSLSLSTSTEVASTSSVVLITKDQTETLTATTTDVASSTTASSTPVIKPVMQKNAWLKFDGKTKGLTGVELIEQIKKMDESKLEHKDEDRVPDFEIDTIKKIKGTLLAAIVVQVQKENIDELWLYNIEDDTQEKIQSGSSTSISSTYPLGVKGGHLFWLSNDESKIFAYSFEAKNVIEKNVPAFDGSEGERAEVVFENIPWKIIVSAEGFTFFSEETGEVFSDENSIVVEAFRKKLKLDAVLNEDELDNLNLPVSQDVQENSEISTP